MCGDGVLASTEDCEDGGTAERDGCSSRCTLWWDSAASSRVPFAISNPAGQSVDNAPILVRVPAAVASTASLGDTSCFVDSDDITLLSWELDHGDAGGSAIFLRVPTVPGAPAERLVWLYLGLPAGQACGPSPSAVWSGVYDAVYHLEPSLQDSAGDNHLSNVGTVDAAGVVGRARDGEATDYLEDTSPSSSILLRGNLSVEAFVRVESLVSTSYPNTVVYFGGTSVETSANNTLYYLGLDPNGRPGHYWEYGEGNDTGTYSSTQILAAGEWHHLAFTRSVADREVRWYIDGATAGTVSTTDMVPTGGSGSWLTLAGNSFNTSRGLDGSLDEVRIASGVKAPRFIALQVASMTGAGVVRQDPIEPQP